jgi:hypothetical protein
VKKKTSKIFVKELLFVFGGSFLARVSPVLSKYGEI